jgi:hypothetical protein
MKRKQVSRKNAEIPQMENTEVIHQEISQNARKVLKIKRQAIKSRSILESLVQDFSASDSTVKFGREAECRQIQKFIKSNIKQNQNGLLDIKSIGL